jgi:glycosyltransferase involved in cell wall biosynthesis
MDRSEPSISVVVVVYDMARELPRTLRSLAPTAQRGVRADDYEVIVVDNGSPAPIDPALAETFPGRIRTFRLDPAPKSPVRAANTGIAEATGDLVGLVIDGARMASPGLLATARLATRLASRPVITSPAWHLGPVPHMRAPEVGYDQTAEDAMLAGTGWEEDGYRLFDVACFAGSSSRGLFGPMGESNGLFLLRETWDALGGLDERFAMPGGGLANHDLYRRACELDDVELVVMLGEGTFHQYHGGAATSRRFTWDEMHADYQAIRGVPHRPPTNVPLHLGTVPPAALPHVERSARLAIERNARLGRTARTG